MPGGWEKSRQHPTGAPPDEDSPEQRRFELLHRVQQVLEPIMVALGLVFLVLFISEYIPLTLGSNVIGWRSRALRIIWFIFLADFGLRFLIAPVKPVFLRQNWLTALSLAVPFLRGLRALRAVRVARSLRLVALLGGVNRGMRVLERVARGRAFAYLGLLTALVVVAGAAGATYFERGAADSPVRDFGPALWWSSTLITTMGLESDPVTFEGRLIALLLRIYALSVFGYITASIASYFVGRDAEARFAPNSAGEPPDPEAGPRDLQHELAAMSGELGQLRRELQRVLLAVDQPPTRSATPSEH